MASQSAVEPTLKISGLWKAFGSNQALADVHLELFPGEIVGLLGANGAGKSTLIKILAGVYDHDAGEVLIGGELMGTHHQQRRIAFLHQDLAVVGGMTVAENIALQSGYSRRSGLISWRRTRAHAVECLRKLDANIDPDLLLSELTSSEAALVAIARALSLEAELLVLDEPTATLSAGESERLLKGLRSLKSRGVAMLFVSHHLQEILSVCDRVVVLRDGRVVLEESTDSVHHDEVVQAITGRAYNPTSREVGATRSHQVRIEVTDLITDRAGPVSFEVRAAEICVLTGLVGAGQHEVGRALAGDRPIYAGQASLAASGLSVADRRCRAEISFTSGDRGREAIARGLTVRENLSVAMRPFTSHRAERASAMETLVAHSVRPLNSEAAIESLSGGNQQKVVIARAVDLPAPILILEDPTGGVDIGARQQIYERLRQQAEGGRSVVLVTSDFEEAALIGTRVLVFRGGHITGTLAGDNLDELDIMNLATGKASGGSS